MYESIILDFPIELVSIKYNFHSSPINWDEVNWEWKNSPLIEESFGKTTNQLKYNNESSHLSSASEDTRQEGMRLLCVLCKTVSNDFGHTRVKIPLNYRPLLFDSWALHPLTTNTSLCTWRTVLKFSLCHWSIEPLKWRSIR